MQLRIFIRSNEIFSIFMRKAHDVNVNNEGSNRPLNAFHYSVKTGITILYLQPPIAVLLSAANIQAPLFPYNLSQVQKIFKHSIINTTVIATYYGVAIFVLEINNQLHQGKSVAEA